MNKGLLKSMEEYAGNTNPYKTAEWISLAYKSYFSLPEIGIPLKKYQDWRKHGILSDRLTTIEAKRKIEVNLFEYLWIQVIKDVREEMGLSYAALQRFKKGFLTPYEYEATAQAMNTLKSMLKEGMEGKDEILKIINDMEEASKIRKESATIIPFDMLVTEVIIQQKDILLVFKGDGDCLVLAQTNADAPYIRENYDKVQEIYRDHFLNQTHLLVPIHKYVAAFISDEKKEKFLKPLGILSAEEEQLLAMTRQGGIKELTITFENGNNKIHKLSTVRDRDLTAEESQELRRVLGLKEYENMTLKSRKGGRIYLEKQSTKKL